MRICFASAFAALCIAIVCVFMSKPLFANAWVLVGIMLGILAFLKFKKSTRRFPGHKHAKVLYLQEFPNVWSSHIGGEWHWRSEWVKEKGRKLFTDRADRQALNERSLEAFHTMLDRLTVQPGAVLISASMLNAPQRGKNRLCDRISALVARPDWSYRIVRRRLGVFTTLYGRFVYRWAVSDDPEDSFLRGHALGVVAWRTQDPMPPFDRLALDVFNDVETNL